MPRFNIETYLNSLPAEDTTSISIDGKRVTELPDITRFINLKHLFCENNSLTYLPALPDSLETLNCSGNKLTSLPPLPANLQCLDCSYNSLKSLPPLPASIQYLFCMKNQLISLQPLPANLKSLYLTGNQLTTLPALPENLLHLHCNHNRLHSIPILPESLTSLGYTFNPICEIINTSDLIIANQQMRILHSFRHLRWSLWFKTQFKNWLWEKVRKPKIEEKYHPRYLIANLNEDIDLDRFLDYWINVI